MSTNVTAEGLEVENVVIGSGFGGAAVGCRLAQAGERVVMLEGGKNFPLGRGEVHTTGHGTRTIGHGHFQFDLGYGMSVVRGRGVGGGSLHYYGVREPAKPEIFLNGRWPADVRRATLDPYYEKVTRMLASNPVKANPLLGIPARGKTFIEAARLCRRAQGDPDWMKLAVYFDYAERETPAGVAQTRCVFCGECLLGCPGSASFAGNVNARNLLTLNYLAVAQQNGLRIFAEHYVEQIAKNADGSFTVVVRLGDPGPQSPDPQRITLRVTKRVVLAAGTLGTVEILLRSREHLGLHNPLLGQRFSGNGDFLVPTIVNIPLNMQPTAGPTITAGCDFSTKENHIFIQDLGLTPRSETIFKRLMDPERNIDYHRMGMLGMGTDAGDGELRLIDGRIVVIWKPEASLPMYREMIAAMRELAQVLGGDFAYPWGYDPLSGSGLLTAHPLGGAIMGETPESGVADAQGKVYGVEGLYVADGALVPSALAINPSFTISALAERVAFHLLHGREMRPGEADA